MLEQKIIYLTRFISYIGVSIYSIIFPILIFKISHSVKLSALIMLVEWIPKLLVYVYGGIIINYFKLKKTYIWMEICRIFVFLLFLLAFYNHNIILLFLLAPISQCSNAISNIIFENLITYWWKNNNLHKAFSSLTYLDLIASIIIIPLMYYLSINHIIIIGLLSFSLSLLFAYIVNFKHLSLLNGFNSYDISLKDSIQFIYTSKKLLLNCFVAISFNIPIAIIGSQLPFFLAKFNTLNNQLLISNYKATSSIIAILFLMLISFLNFNLIIFYICIFLFLLSLLGILFSNTISLFFITIVLNSICFYIYSVFNKKNRQQLIPDKYKLSLTGILISIEAFSYIIASILSYSLNNIYYSIYFCIFIFTFSLLFIKKIIH